MIRIGRVLEWNWTTEELLQLAAFITGCLIGIVCFSKILRLLLKSAESATMSVLCGIMIGSLRRVWPFQQALTSGSNSKHPQFEAVWPAGWDGQVTTCLLLAITAFAGVLVMHHLAHVIRPD